MPLEVAGDFRIGVYVIDKCRVPLFCYLFEYAVVLLAPPAVVDAVVMVSCAGYGSGVEVRIFQDGCSGHESSSGMPVYPDLGAVNPRILCSKPLHGSLLVFKPVVAEIAIAVVVIPFGPVRMSSAVAHGNYYEAHLCQPVRAGHSCAPGYVVRLHLRSRIYIFYYRINLCGVEVKWLVHHAVKVSDAVGGLHRESFRKPVARLEKL